MVSPSVLLASDALRGGFTFLIGGGVCGPGVDCVSPVFRSPIQPSLLLGFVDDEVKCCIPKCKVYV